MDLYYENNKLARVRVAEMSGSSGIGFYRLVANLEFTFTSRDDDVTLFPLTGRFPLLQRVVATAFSRDEATVRIGIQDLDGTGLTISPPSSASQIDAAERKVRHLAKQVLRLVAAGAP
jgi:hypothetical protein